MFNMWQNIITAIIVVIALFFIGKKLYKQLRQAVDPSKEITCGNSCGCCASNSCDDRKEN